MLAIGTSVTIKTDNGGFARGFLAELLQVLQTADGLAPLGEVVISGAGGPEKRISATRITSFKVNG